MGRIRDALAVLPTKPVLVIAPLIIVLVLAFYYRDRHASCTEMHQFRATLGASLDAIPARERVRLAELTDFPWDRVRIVTGFVPRDRSAACPFEWNWADGERAALIGAGALTALIFAQGDRIAAYREIDGSEIAIRGVSSLLTPQTAIFELTRAPEGGVILTRTEPRAGASPLQWYTNGIKNKTIAIARQIGYDCANRVRDGRGKTKMRS